MAEQKHLNQSWIKRVHFKSPYKSIVDCEVELMPGLNVIIGKNGTGKTNFLEYLHGVGNLRNGFKGKEFDVEIQFDYGEQAKLFNRKSPEGQFEEPVFEFQGRQQTEYLEKFKRPDVYTGFHIPVLHYAGFSVPGDLPLLSQPFQADYGENSIDEALLRKNRAFQADDGAKWLLALLAKLKYNFLVEEVSPSGIEAGIKELEKELHNFKTRLSQTSKITDVRFRKGFAVSDSTLDSRYFISNLNLEFQLNGKWLLFSQLSDGLRRIILVTGMVSHLDDKIEMFEFEVGFNCGPSRILLVDEPELGLHPYQIRKLMDLLTSISTYHQVIVTTHSPLVLDSIKENELERILISTFSPSEGTQFHRLSGRSRKMIDLYWEENMRLSDAWIETNLIEEV